MIKDDVAALLFRYHSHLNMEHLQALLKKTRAKSTARSERGELLQWFLDQLTPHWSEHAYGKLTIGRLAKKLEGQSLDTLRYMQREMISRDRDISRGVEKLAPSHIWFWSSIKPKV